MTQVTATFEAYFDEPGDVTRILDGWTVEEVEELLSGSSEALDELASQGWHVVDPSDVYVTVERDELEAYLAERGKVAPPRKEQS